MTDIRVAAMTEQSSIPVEAQAVPTNEFPFGWLFEGPEYTQFSKSTDFIKPVLDLHIKMAKDQPDKYTMTPLFTRPTPAAADLHQQSNENLNDCPACGNSYLAIRTDIYKDKREFIYCDCCGCLADRRVWNRIAASPAAAAGRKLVPIEPTKEMLGAICEAEFLRKPANAVYAAVLAASPVALNIRDNSQCQRNPQMMPIETAPKGGSFLAKDEHGWEVWNAEAYWSAIAADAPAHMPRDEARALTHWHPLPENT